MSNEITIIEPAPLSVRDPFLDVLFQSLSDNSKRQYEHTFKDWRAWCEQHNPPIAVDELTAVNVLAYLRSRPISRSTALNRLAHLRAGVKIASAVRNDPYMQQCYTQLSLIKLSVDWKGAPPNEDSQKRGQKRKGEYIDPARVHELLNAYPVKNDDGSSRPRGIRNRALLAVLFYAGLRRFEAAKLEWSHIDFDDGLIAVVGGKARDRNEVDYVPFLGSIGYYLENWRAHVPDERRFVFPRIHRYGALGIDKPITPDGLYKQFSDDFAPHDARRTLISDLLKNGAYIADVKVISRHKNDSTLLKYAKSHGAQVVKERVKVGY